MNRTLAHTLPPTQPRTLEQGVVVLPRGAAPALSLPEFAGVAARSLISGPAPSFAHTRTNSVASQPPACHIPPPFRSLWLRWREAAVIGRWKPMLAQCLPVVAPEQQVFKTDPHLWVFEVHVKYGGDVARPTHAEVIDTHCDQPILSASRIRTGLVAVAAPLTVFVALMVLMVMVPAIVPMVPMVLVVLISLVGVVGVVVGLLSVPLRLGNVEHREVCDVEGALGRAERHLATTRVP
mmetsp:Transcript_61256/g.168055  ORF Transcript_61256/g.168055 Transcript_61256/m.168055 type:complete len:237 (-) Transcript_61256:203-913(-)